MAVYSIEFVCKRNLKRFRTLKHIQELVSLVPNDNLLNTSKDLHWTLRRDCELCCDAKFDVMSAWLTKEERLYETE